MPSSRQKDRSTSETSRIQAIMVLSSVFILSACASVGAPDRGTPNLTSAGSTVCQPLSEERHETIDFYFGLSITGNPNGVTERDWTLFSKEHLAPMFPSGFSVYDLQGAWREDGQLHTERSKRVSVILPVEDTNAEKIRQLSDAYRQRFDQYSVLVNRYPSDAVLCQASGTSRPQDGSRKAHIHLMAIRRSYDCRNASTSEINRSN